ncbi:MAG: flap endonuclease-1 [Desulfurococcaceae archaeon]|nr:MAG: flap endonuclease-1 [Desulfurococcaceae archaeon]
MGVDLKDLIPEKAIRQINDLRELSGKIIAIDAYNALYQFLAAIRQPDGTPLMDSKGRVTSHLSGLFYRTINLVEAGIKPVYVFDGKPPEIKAAEIARRSIAKQKAEERLRIAREKGDEEEMRKYAQATSRLSNDMVESSKKLLSYMGIPWVQAPSEGEAQAAYMAMKGIAWATASQDYDSLLFGSPRLVRNLTVSGKRKLPGKEIYVEIKPEVIDLNLLMKTLEITREQLIDIAILVGTDFNPDGVEGIGPKKAYSLVKSYGSIDRVLKVLPGARFPVDPMEIKKFFLNPPISEVPRIEWKAPDREKVIELLVEEYEFSRERVENNLERLSKAISRASAARGLDKWFG